MNKVKYILLILCILMIGVGCDKNIEDNTTSIVVTRSIFDDKVISINYTRLENDKLVSNKINKLDEKYNYKGTDYNIKIEDDNFSLDGIVMSEHASNITELVIFKKLIIFKEINYKIYDLDKKMVKQEFNNVNNSFYGDISLIKNITLKENGTLDIEYNSITDTKELLIGKNEIIKLSDVYSNSVYNTKYNNLKKLCVNGNLNWKYDPVNYIITYSLNSCKENLQNYLNK